MYPFDLGHVLKLFERFVEGVERVGAALERMPADVNSSTGADASVQFLSADEVAKRAAIDRQTVFRWERQGKLPSRAVSDGKFVRWDAAEIDEALRAAREQEASPDTGPTRTKPRQARPSTRSDRKRR